LPHQVGIAIPPSPMQAWHNSSRLRFRLLHPAKSSIHRSMSRAQFLNSVPELLRDHRKRVALRLKRPSSLSMFSAVDFTSGRPNPSTTGRDEEGNIPAFQQHQRCWDFSTRLSTWPQGMGPWCMAKTVSTFRFARLTACATSRINSGSYNDPSSFNARVSLA